MKTKNGYKKPEGAVPPHKHARASLHSEVVTYTPKMALAILDRSDKHINRAVADRAVARYAEAMKRGEWIVNGESIKLDKDGLLVDGQHRLWAVVAAEVPVMMYTTYGVDRSAFDTLDTGKPRRVPDILSIIGEKNCTTIQGALTLCYRQETGSLCSTMGPDNSQVEALMGRHSAIRDSVSYISVLRNHVKGLRGFYSVSMAVYLHYAFAKLDHDLADKFFLKLYTGEDMGGNNPIMLLRNRLLADTTAHAKISRVERLALTIKTWNAVRSGHSSKRLLKWAYGANEKFPSIE